MFAHVRRALPTQVRIREAIGSELGELRTQERRLHSQEQKLQSLLLAADASPFAMAAGDGADAGARMGLAASEGPGSGSRPEGSTGQAGQAGEDEEAGQAGKARPAGAQTGPRSPFGRTSPTGAQIEPPVSPLGRSSARAAAAQYRATLGELREALALHATPQPGSLARQVGSEEEAEARDAEIAELRDLAARLKLGSARAPGVSQPIHLGSWANEPSAAALDSPAGSTSGSTGTTRRGRPF